MYKKVLGSDNSKENELENDYEDIKKLLIKYSNIPSCPVSVVISDLGIRDALGISSKLRCLNIKTFADLMKLKRNDWLQLEINEERRETLIYKLKILKHFNRFEQQTKNYFSFVLVPNVFVLIMLVLSFFSIAAYIFASYPQKDGDLNWEVRYDNHCPIQLPGGPSCLFSTEVSLTSAQLASISSSSEPDLKLFLYYKLTNFYQNVRNFIKSVSYAQLACDLEATSSCGEFTTVDGKLLYPCGKAALSYFNDSFTITGIPLDKQASKARHEFLLYRNFYSFFKNNDQISDYFFRRKDSSFITIPRPEIEDPAFTNWLNFAVLKDFVKFYGTFTLPRAEVLKQKKIVLDFEVSNYFDVSSFEGTKSLILRSGIEVVQSAQLLKLLSFCSLLFCVLAGISLPVCDAVLRKRREKRRLVYA